MNSDQQQPQTENSSSSVSNNLNVPETPTTPNDTNPPILPFKSRSSRFSKKLLFIVLLAFTVALGTFYWLVLKDTTSSPQNSTQTNTSENTTFNPNEKFGEYANKIREIYPEMSYFKSYDNTVESSNSSIILFSNTIEHYVRVKSPDNWSGLIGRDGSQPYSLDDYNTEPFNYLVSMLRSDGFSDYTSEGQPILDEPRTKLQKDSIICEITKFSSDRIFYSCVNSNDINDAATLAELFYEPYLTAYPEANTNNCLVISVNNSDIKSSKDFPDYEIANTGVECAGQPSGFKVSFYRTKNSEWLYSHRTQGDYSLCSDFDNIDQRKAFAATNCYPEEQSSSPTTVKEYFSL